MATSILKLPAVQSRTQLSRSTIYLKISQDAFPKPIRLGEGRAVGWIESEIQDWIEQQIAISRRDA